MLCQVYSHITSVDIGTTFRRRLPEIAPKTPLKRRKRHPPKNNCRRRVSA